MVPLFDGSAALAEPEPEAETSKPARKRRLPDDWWPSPQLQAWARQTLGVDEDWLAWNTEQFRDYWRGSGKPMLRWDLTWQRWMRTELERSGRRPGAQTAAPSRAAQRESNNRSVVERFARADGYDLPNPPAQPPNRRLP